MGVLQSVRKANDSAARNGVTQLQLQHFHAYVLQREYADQRAAKPAGRRFAMHFHGPKCIVW